MYKLRLSQLNLNLWMIVTTVDGWNPDNQLRLVVYPIICRVSAPSQVVGLGISAINSINHHHLSKILSFDSGLPKIKGKLDVENNEGAVFVS